MTNHSHAHHHDMGGAADDGAKHAPPAQRAHGTHAGHSPTMFRGRFWISAALTLPAALWWELATLVTIMLALAKS